MAATVPTTASVVMMASWCSSYQPFAASAADRIQLPMSLTMFLIGGMLMRGIVILGMWIEIFGKWKLKEKLVTRWNTEVGTDLTAFTTLR